MTSLANDFEPSIAAAAALGPKTAIPAGRSTSATPPTSGASGPITTRSMSSELREREQALGVLGTYRVALAEPRDPRAPGRGMEIGQGGACASFQASACSRPPDPTRRTRIG